jgi:hypothetical protein
MKMPLSGWLSRRRPGLSAVAAQRSHSNFAVTLAHPYVQFSPSPFLRIQTVEKGYNPVVT